MTKSPAVGSAVSNFVHVGHVGGPRKLKDQTKGDGLDFPTLISQQDPKIPTDRLARNRSIHGRISDDDGAAITPIEDVEHSKEDGLSNESYVDVQEVDGEFPNELDGQNSTVVLQTKLETQSDLAALWQHLNGGKKPTEVAENQTFQNPLKVGLQNVAARQMQTTVREIELNVGSTKKPVEANLENAEISQTPKFTKNLKADVAFFAKVDEDILVEKIPVKVLNVETHFAFNTAPSLSFQLAGAVTEQMKGEVTKLQFNSSKLILDPNAAIIKSLHIQLIPESLGELKVLMHLRGSELTMKIEASSKLAAMKLSEDKDLLKDLLEKAGFEMAGEPVLIVVRSEQPTNSDARMNDQAQDKQPAGDSNTLNYGKNFGDGNERQQKHDLIRNTENSPAKRPQDLAETRTGRNDRKPASNSTSGLYL